LFQVSTFEIRTHTATLILYRKQIPVYTSPNRIPASRERDGRAKFLIFSVAPCEAGTKVASYTIKSINRADFDVLSTCLLKYILISNLIPFYFLHNILCNPPIILCNKGNLRNPTLAEVNLLKRILKIKLIRHLNFRHFRSF